MKTSIVLVLTLATVVGSTAVVAAQGEPRHLDKRVVVAGNKSTDAGEKVRNPVTFLGVAVAPAHPALAAQLKLPEGQGLVVNFVEPESPGAKAGLQKHDVLTKLDDQILIDPRQLSVLVRGRKEGETVTLTYLRAGAEARATATLATHVPGPEPFFKWSGTAAPDVLYHFENFGSPPEMHLLTPEAGADIRFDGALPHPAPAPGPGVRAFPAERGKPGDRVVFFPPQANLVFSDGDGSLQLRVGAQGQELIAKNADGETVFSGPVGTPEQRAALPEDLRRRLEKLEKLDPTVFETPVPSAGHVVVPRAGTERHVRVGEPVM